VERAVTWVAGQGITQFIDLGAGLPTAPNTHVTAQAASPAAAVAYVDNDPVVISHLTALLAHHSARVAVIAGDLHDRDAVLGATGADFPGAPAAAARAGPCPPGGGEGREQGRRAGLPAGGW
jgi:hypothetical protein